MATGRTPDASETKRPEDSRVTGYDKNGKARTWLTSQLKNGELPDGFTAAPPEGTHPNDPNNPKNSGIAESVADAGRAAELDRREAAIAEREARLAEKGAGGRQK